MGFLHRAHPGCHQQPGEHPELPRRVPVLLHHGPLFMLTSAVKPLVSAGMLSQAWPSGEKRAPPRHCPSWAAAGKCVHLWPQIRGVAATAIPTETSEKTPCPGPAGREPQAERLTVGGVPPFRSQELGRHPACLCQDLVKKNQAKNKMSTPKSPPL